MARMSRRTRSGGREIVPCNQSRGGRPDRALLSDHTLLVCLAVPLRVKLRSLLRTRRCRRVRESSTHCNTHSCGSAHVQLWMRNETPRGWVGTQNGGATYRTGHAPLLLVRHAQPQQEQPAPTIFSRVAPLLVAACRDDLCGRRILLLRFIWMTKKTRSCFLKMRAAIGVVMCGMAHALTVRQAHAISSPAMEHAATYTLPW